ncbi:hypothetical protein [Pseudomonas sp. NPDC089569]|uniref:hypothetical protein n=1 Tax=Pseudomonas sp. NPDC089569 TaxID=3390722 RepID=UPI003D0574F7
MKMVMHYSVGDALACGQTNNTVSTPDVKRVTCQKCVGSARYQQARWFVEFQDNTGTEPMGLEEWVTGTMPFAQAAKHSLACYRIEVQETADRLERSLDTRFL